jgi:hypothetical protein
MLRSHAAPDAGSSIGQPASSPVLVAVEVFLDELGVAQNEPLLITAHRAPWYAIERLCALSISRNWSLPIGIAAWTGVQAAMIRDGNWLPKIHS